MPRPVNMARARKVIFLIFPYSSTGSIGLDQGRAIKAKEMAEVKQAWPANRCSRCRCRRVGGSFRRLAAPCRSEPCAPLRHQQLSYKMPVQTQTARLVSVKCYIYYDCEPCGFSG